MAVTNLHQDKKKINELINEIHSLFSKYGYTGRSLMFFVAGVPGSIEGEKVDGALALFGDSKQIGQLIKGEMERDEKFRKGMKVILKELIEEEDD